MTTSTLDAQLEVVVGAESPGRIAVMLYGSVARGTADIHSDIDVLELVASDPRSYQMKSVNVTQYVPAHLRIMADQGSLFVLHLRQDGVVLSDEFGVLRAALDAYVEPPDYKHVWQQLAVAAGALDERAVNFSSHLPGLARLGIYILRTAAYIRSVELGRPEFDLARLAHSLGDTNLAAALAMRRQKVHLIQDVVFIRRQIDRLVPGAYRNPHQTVEAYAVTHSTRSDLAALFAAVLRGDGPIEYSSLTMPPF